MIDGGIILIVIGLLLMIAAPLERRLAHRDVERAAISPDIRRSFPVTSSAPPFDGPTVLIERSGHAPVIITRAPAARTRRT